MTDFDTLKGPSFHHAAGIYLHLERWHALRQQVDVPYETIRTEETSRASEGGLGGTIFGIIKGSSKLASGTKVTRTFVIHESDIIAEVCRKAVSTVPPIIFPISDPEDWNATSDGQIVLVKGEFNLVDYERFDEKYLVDFEKQFLQMTAECCGKKVTVSFHGSHTIRDSLWYMLERGSVRGISCIGRLIEDCKLGENVVIEPTMIGRIR